MKIGVVGCGALGSYYGAKLCRDGRMVHFLLRSDYEAVRRNGLQIRSLEGDFRVHPKCARAPEEVGPCDLVLIGLKTTANDQFSRLLPPLVGADTALLTLQNGLGNEARLADLFGREKILGGLCFVCLNRTEPGVVEHLAHGTIVMGEYQRWPEPRTQNIASLFRHAGVPCKVTDDLECAHWEKLIWNIPFNGLGVAGAAGYETVLSGFLRTDVTWGPCLPTDQLLGEPRWEKLVYELMKEVITVANALGLKIPASAAERQISRTRAMGAYKASTLIDFERHHPLELEAMFLEPLRQAQRAKVPTPRLAVLCDVLRQMEPR
ncbi:MAG TPA: 2-dehydropantoate 2-reductase [Candidatus Angelobacter sp.]|nr:2-dehydropantoate 2-reductase [Candidatus Angelobacter sp.]